MNSIQDWLKLAIEKKTSDIFLGAGRAISFKIDGIIRKEDKVLTRDESSEMVNALFELGGREIDKFLANGDDDFSITLPGVARFRVSAYHQRGSIAAVIRAVPFGLPDFQDLGITNEVMKIADEKNGLVLVTGPAGSGKTTTLACIIDAINKSRAGHIITLEDPIEFLHRDDKCLVSQREVSSDTISYVTALKACLRQAPDIILLGEMRDQETIEIAMTAAETGHLVISTLHTIGAASTIDRIVDAFPPQQQPQVRLQLSMSLKTVVSQQLLPKIDGGSAPAFEIMHMNPAISNLVREAKSHQIDNAIQTSAGAGMIGMDAYILNLFKKGTITKQTAVSDAVNPVQMARLVGL